MIFMAECKIINRQPNGAMTRDNYHHFVEADSAHEAHNKILLFYHEKDRTEIGTNDVQILTIKPVIVDIN
jgi:hypothetical protein